jgi:hypothetical protein
MLNYAVAGHALTDTCSLIDAHWQVQHAAHLETNAQANDYNKHSPTARTLFAFPATMSFFSRKVTYSSYAPSGRTSINGVLHHRSSKATSIQSHQESISNSSIHTVTAAIHRDHSGRGSLPSVSNDPSESSSISDHKSFQHLQKTTFDLQNQSLSTLSTTREPESNGGFTTISTQRQEFRSLSLSSLEDENETSPPSSPHVFRDIDSTLTTDPNPIIASANGFTSVQSAKTGSVGNTPTDLISEVKARGAELETLRSREAWVRLALAQALRTGFVYVNASPGDEDHGVTDEQPKIAEAVITLKKLHELIQVRNLSVPAWSPS